MGCDIHMFVEKRQPDGTWTLVLPDPSTGYCYEKARSMTEAEREAYAKTVADYRYVPDNIEDQPLHTRASWYDQRNYELFSWLADVRNYGMIQPANFYGRGIPADCSDDYRTLAYEDYYHSHTYATLREVKAALDRPPSVEQEGVISCSQYDKLQLDLIKPESWSSVVSGNIVILSGSTYEELRDNGLVEVRSGNGNWYETHFVNNTPIAVEANWADDVSRFSSFSRFIEELEGLGEDPDNLRIVFFFDS